MKKLKNTMKRIATLGLAAVLLTNSFPAEAFAAEIRRAQRKPMRSIRSTRTPAFSIEVPISRY